MVIRSLSYWWKLRRLQATKRQIDAEFRPKVDRAKFRDLDKYEELSSEWRFQAYEVLDAIGDLRTKRLIAQSERYSVPVPESQAKDGTSNEAWKTGEMGERYLSPEAAHQLRATIRRERNEQWDVWLRWVSVAAAIVSVVGALVSLWGGIF